MGQLIFDITMSLDGFVRAANPTPEKPLGEGGEELHNWAMKDADGQEMLGKGIGGTGAMICGRKTYDDSLPFWKANGPSGKARVPLFVVTHEKPDNVPADSVYHFVEEGIEAALEQAQDTAGQKDVVIMGGPTIARQFIQAGLVDEISLHVAPLLFGSGLRLFEQEDGDVHIRLGTPEVRETEQAIHVRYPILK